MNAVLTLTGAINSLFLYLFLALFHSLHLKMLTYLPNVKFHWFPLGLCSSRIIKSNVYIESERRAESVIKRSNMNSHSAQSLFHFKITVIWNRITYGYASLKFDLHNFSIYCIHQEHGPQIIENQNFKYLSPDNKYCICFVKLQYRFVLIFLRVFVFPFDSRKLFVEIRYHCVAWKWILTNFNMMQKNFSESSLMDVGIFKALNYWAKTNWLAVYVRLGIRRIDFHFMCLFLYMYFMRSERKEQWEIRSQPLRRDSIYVRFDERSCQKYVTTRTRNLFVASSSLDHVYHAWMATEFQNHLSATYHVL